MRPQPLAQRYSPVVDGEKEKQVVYTVDSFRNGIEIGRSVFAGSGDPRAEYHLSLADCAKPQKPRTRHALEDGTPFEQLERRLRSISEKGDLSSAWFYFGVASDPFHPFEGKFDASIKFLKIFQRYSPGMLFLQTRSPLVVVALSMLQNLGKHVVVTLALETMRQEIVSRYTPGLPSVRERLRAASALRNFGVEVAIQVAPLLPYGARRRDARVFAELLCNYADSIFVQPLNDGSGSAAERIHGSLIAQSIALEQRNEWLKKDAAEPLIEEIMKIAPHKLEPPRPTSSTVRQMSFFVA